MIQHGDMESLFYSAQITSVTVTDTSLGLKSWGECSKAQSTVHELTSNSTSFTVKDPHGCHTSINASYNLFPKWNVSPVKPEDCGFNGSVSQAPVVFWLNAGTAVAQKRSVISFVCRPYLHVANVEAQWNISSDEYSIGSMSISSGNTEVDLISIHPNNVTGFPLYSQAFNG